MEGISTTNSTLLPAINRYATTPQQSKNAFFKREIASRILALAIPFFRSTDAIANFGVAIGKSIGHIGLKLTFPVRRLFRTVGIKRLPMSSYSTKVISSHFKAAYKAITYKPDMLFKLMAKPVGAQKYLQTIINPSMPVDPLEIDHQGLANRDLQTKSPEELDRDWNLKDYTGHIYVINLDDRPNQNGVVGDSNKKRFEAVTQNLNLIGTKRSDFERLPATYGKYDLDHTYWDRMHDNTLGLSGEAKLRSHQAQTGILMSHYRAIKNAHENYTKYMTELDAAQLTLQQATSDDARTAARIKCEEAARKVKEYSRVLILEDDNGFGLVTKKNSSTRAQVTQKNAGVLFRKAMQELPHNWDMLYFTAVECERGGVFWLSLPHKFSKHLDKLDYGVCANAFMVHHTAYERILKSLSAIDDPTKKLKPVDHLYGRMHHRMKAFASYPPLAYQGVGISTVSDGKLDEPWNGTWNRGF